MKHFLCEKTTVENKIKKVKFTKKTVQNMKIDFNLHALPLFFHIPLMNFNITDREPTGESSPFCFDCSFEVKHRFFNKENRGFINGLLFEKAK